MPSIQQLEKQVAELEARLAEANKPKPLSLKVSEKGGVSIYGLNARFPTTLYKDQWLRVIDYIPTIQKFMKDNEAKLSVK